MKTEVLDILMYLFETYLDDDQSILPTQDSVVSELSRIGFREDNVTKAFNWLDDLADLKDNIITIEQTDKRDLRTFSKVEMEKINSSARAQLLNLVELDVISPAKRELIIDKALALDISNIDLEQMRWVILMVLFNMPESEASFTWLQDLLYNEWPTLH
jgi:Smg protein